MRGFVLLLAALGLPSQAVAGTVGGTVKLIEKKGRLARDHSSVVVYVDGLEVAMEPREVSLTMENKAFVPHLAVIPVGGRVTFPNEDPIFHNVFSVSGDNRFDLGLYKKSTGKVQTFEHPGVVRVYCNIHPQMSAIVLVRENPYYTRAEADGSFRIEGVPAGRRTITAWHEKARETTSLEVEVSEGEVEIELVLDTSKYKRKRHKNKHGKKYKTRDKY